MRLDPLSALFLAGWAYYFFGVYTPRARRFRRQRVTLERTRPLDILLDMFTFVCWQVLPLVAILTAGLRAFDYTLPAWARALGLLPFGASLGVLTRAYRDLGENWSPKIDVRAGQRLVTSGIYAWVRHPIYAGMFLWALAQPLLVPNWLGGCLMLPAFSLLYAIRMPQEERMLLEHFGQEYRSYMATTGRLLPRRRRRREPQGAP
jgi:protein-S-isoprenylcysteine O-methyltransferase Ste14